jgi:hypothetical protein
MSDGTDPNSVRKVVTVDAPPTVAWRVFTEEMSWRFSQALSTLADGQNIGAGQAVAFLTPRAEPPGVICIGRTEEE